MVQLPPLRDYQKEAIEHWIKAGKKGIISLPTGSGKTVVALAIWKMLGEPKTLYIAPTNALIKDLVYKFQMKYGIPAHYISDNPRKPKKITFATYAMIGTHQPELAKDYDFYILDEAHHAAAENFFLRALPIILEQNKPVLGLSASPKTSSEYSDAMLRKLPVVYRRTFKEKEMSIYRPKTVLYLTGVHFSPAEQSIYNELDEKLREIRKKSGYRIKSVVDASRLMKYNDALGKLAGAYLKAYNERKRLTQKTPKKIEAVVNIVKRHRNEDRIMIFADTVDELVKVVKELNRIGIPAFAMTSKTVTAKDIKTINEDFGTKYKVLGLVKMGEEGIDFPDLNVLIIMGSPKSERAIIQRVGRVLRFKEGKTAHIYFVFVEGTYEEETAKKYISKVHPDEVISLDIEELEEKPVSIPVEIEEREEEFKPVELPEVEEVAEVRTIDTTILNKLIETYSSKAEEIAQQLAEMKKSLSTLQLWLNPKFNNLQKAYNIATKRTKLLEAIKSYLEGTLTYGEFIKTLKSYNYTTNSIEIESWIPESIRKALHEKLNKDKGEQDWRKLFKVR